MLFRSILASLQGHFAVACATAVFVMAKVDGDAPEVGGKLGGRLPFASASVEAGEGLLREVLGAMQVGGHAHAKVADRAFPAVDDLRERLGIIVVLHAPHGLLIRHGRRKMLDRVAHGLGAFDARGGGPFKKSNASRPGLVRKDRG